LPWLHSADHLELVADGESQKWEPTQSAVLRRSATYSECPCRSGLLPGGTVDSNQTVAIM